MSNSEQEKKRLVEPMTLKGFQDYLPSEMISRNQVVEKIRVIYEKYGFLPIDTPVLEYLVTLIGTGGEAINKELFKLESPEREPIAMRFDLTVPFARIIAQYPENIKLPFKRYHIGPVFRADKPGLGRLRQFTQFDIDAAGSDSVAVDAEIVAAMCEVLNSLGLRNDEPSDASVQEYQVRVNNRKLMDALLKGCGITDEEIKKHVLRVVDKLQKVGMDNIRKELSEGRIDDSGDPIKGVGLDASTINQLIELISVKGNSRGDIVESLAKLLPVSKASDLALQEMRDFAAALESLGVKENEAVFDPSLARGLDYYTGPVFEAFFPAAPEFGSVMGGGRYDQLVERFLDNKIPATGVSIGLDRLMAALSVIGKVKFYPTTIKVIVLAVKGVAMTELLGVVRELRVKNIPSEVYMGDPQTSMRDQLSYANSKEIPIAVIIGPDEIQAGKASVKDLVVGKEKRTGIKNHEQYKKAGKVGQVMVDRRELCETILEMLGGQDTDETGY